MSAEEDLDGCDICGESHDTEDCPELAEESILESSVSRARLTIPYYACVLDRPDGSVSVLAKETIKAKTRMGPFEAKRTTQNIDTEGRFVLKVLSKDGQSVSLDTSSEQDCNWLCLIQTALQPADQNCMALQIGTDIYYTTTRDVTPETELLVWYAPHYAKKLGKPPVPDGLTEVSLNKDTSISQPMMEVQAVFDDDRNLLIATGQNSQEAHSLKQEAVPVAGDDDYGGSADIAPIDITLQTISSLSRPRDLHILHKGSAVGMRKCSRCGQQFETLKELAKHIKQHILEREKAGAKKQDKTETYSPKEKRKRGRPRLNKEDNKVPVRKRQMPKEKIPSDRESTSESKAQESGMAGDKSPVRKSSRCGPKLFSVTEVLGIKTRTESAKVTKVKYSEVKQSNDKKKNVKKSANVKNTIRSTARNIIEDKALIEEAMKNKSVVVLEQISVIEESDAIHSDHDYERSPIKPSPTKTLPESRVQDSHLMQAESASTEPQNLVTEPANTFEGSADTVEPSTSISVNSIAGEAVSLHQPTSLISVKAECQSQTLDDLMDGILESNAGSQEDKALGDLVSSEPQQEPQSTTEGIVLELEMNNSDVAGANVQSTHIVANELNDEKTTQLKKDGAAKIWKCEVCGKVFLQKKNLNRHMEGHKETFECSKCSKVYVRKESLQKHKCPADKKVQADDGGGEHFCEFCGAKFSQEVYLARHMATHTGEFSCEKCKRTYARKESLLSHLSMCDPDALKRRGLTAFVCQICKRAFTKETSLENHMKIHTGENRCETCGKSFTSVFSLNRHQCSGISVVEQTEPLFCDYCPKSFKKEIALQRHMAKHQGKYSCMVCEKNYTNKPELKKHLIECSARQQATTTGEVKCSVCSALFSDIPSYVKHYEEHTHPYQCETCGKRFLRKVNLQKHQCKTDEGTGPFPCPVCQKEFSLYRYLQNHMAVHQDKMLECPLCHKLFATEAKLNKHMCVDPNTGNSMMMARTTDGTVRLYPSNTSLICQLCGKSFSSVSNLNKHIKCHGDKTEECDVCGKKFHLKISLSMHKRMVHTTARLYKCKYCDKSMKSKNSLYGHYAAYHKETVLLFGCKECNKKFRHKGNLKKHMAIHSEKKAFHCEECNKYFRHPEQKRHHDLWHKHGNRFKCSLCDRSYVMEFELKRHVNTFHGGIIYSCKYCETDCHFLHTMKRHLIRHHFAIKEWQQNPIEFCKTLAKENKAVLAKLGNISSNVKTEPEDPQQPQSQDQIIQIIQQEGDSTLEGSTISISGMLPQQQIQQISLQSEGDDQIQTINTIDPSILESLGYMEEGPGGRTPVIVAEVQGLSNNGEDVTGTQTLIIQTSDGNLVSEQVAAALRSLTYGNTQHQLLDTTGHPTVISAEETSGVGMPVGVMADSQGQDNVIYVPMDNLL